MEFNVKSSWTAGKGSLGGNIKLKPGRNKREREKRGTEQALLMELEEQKCTNSLGARQVERGAITR